jgi:N-formylglutamate deformylase
MVSRMTPIALGLPDTDWFVDQLYAFVTDLDASLLVATHSRYVIDLNRPPGNESLYATRTTGLVPVETFAGEAIYREGEAPSMAETGQRLAHHWQPCHDALAGELERLRAQHGHCVLLDAHSILSHVPALFEGRLPAFNLGSNQGRSAEPSLIHAAAGVLAADQRWDMVLDARFKGGYNTRHYGQPPQNVHALQLEMAQRVYMDEEKVKATATSMAAVQPLLQRLVEVLVNWRPGHA